ncbi:formin-like protein 20-like, partial [Trifolium pratense]
TLKMKNLAIPLPTSTDSFKIRFSHLILQHVPQSHRSITVSTFFSLPCFHSIATSPYKYPSMVPRVESKLRVFAFKIQAQVTKFRKSLNTVNSGGEELRKVTN